MARRDPVGGTHEEPGPAQAMEGVRFSRIEKNTAAMPSRVSQLLEE